MTKVKNQTLKRQTFISQCLCISSWIFGAKSSKHSKNTQQNCKVIENKLENDWTDYFEIIFYSRKISEKETERVEKIQKNINIEKSVCGNWILPNGINCWKLNLQSTFSFLLQAQVENEKQKWIE